MALIVTALLVLGIGYGGAYWWLMGSVVITYGYGGPKAYVQREPRYRHEALGPFFAPAHWLDSRFIRPDLWRRRPLKPAP